MEKKQLTSIRLSPLGKRLLEMLAAELGISQTAVLEMCIRGHARRWKARTQEDSKSVQGAFLNLASSVTTLGLEYGTVRTRAAIAINAVASEPEHAHLVPLLEQMRETWLASLSQFLDAIPPEVAELMDAAHEFAGE
jgi:hypothetical protein